MSKLDRRAVTQRLLQDRGDLLVVAGLGSPAWDLAAAGDHDANIYLWGAMGGAAMIGLGLALAQPDRPVLVLTGDGEQLMGVGGFATIAAAGAENLTVAVLDNQRYGETGMQTSHTGLGADLAAIAAASGIADARRIQAMQEVDALRTSLRDPGPRVAVIEIDDAEAQRVLPLRDGAAMKTRFRARLGLPPI